MLAPAAEAGFVRAVFVAGGRVGALRTLPPGEGTRVEIAAGLATLEHQVAQSYLEAEALDALLVLGTFLRRPPPELRVAPLDAAEILRRAEALRSLAPAPAVRAA